MKVTLTIELEPGESPAQLARIAAALKETDVQSEVPVITGVTLTKQTTEQPKPADGQGDEAAQKRACRYCGMPVTGRKQICDAPECRRRHKTDNDRRFLEKKKLTSEATFDDAEDVRRPFGLGIKK